MGWLVLHQDNTGGVYDDTLGVVVFAEGATEKEATAAAEAAGVDFTDACPCCGPRWSVERFCDDDGRPTDLITGEDLGALDSAAERVMSFLPAGGDPVHWAAPPIT